MSAPPGYYPPSEAPKGASVLGIISVILGGIGLPITFIPCLGVLAVPLVMVGLLLGLIGFFVSKSSQRTGTGLDIAGMVVNGAALFVTLAWFGLFFIVGRNEAAKQAARDQAMRNDPAIAVPAGQFADQYARKPDEADTKYKDQLVELSGLVNQVSVDEFLDAYTVTLKADANGEPLDVDCDFKKRLDTKVELQKLKPGQKIVIRGKCTGKSPLGRVTLESCVIK
jgi:hypothetical protein